MLAKARSSLASQLASLNDAAPELDDRDPDGEAAAAAASDSDSAPEDAERTSHYVDVGPSKLRKRAQVSESETLRDAKYAGVRARAADFFGGKDEDEEDDEDDDGEDEVEDDEDADDDSADEELDSAEEDEDVDSEEEMDSGQASGDSDAEVETSSRVKAKANKEAKKKQLRFAEEEDGAEDAAGTLAAAARDDAAMVATLRQRNEADAERGEGVKRQMKGWENALGIRIRSQKVVHAAGRIEPRALPALLELAPSSVSTHKATLSNLASTSASLLAIQLHTLRTEHADEQLLDEALATPEGLRAVASAEKANAGKRKREGTDQAQVTSSVSLQEHLEAVDACLALDDACDELHRAILDKWSSRTSIGASGSENKFEAEGNGGGVLRAVNQSVNAQIDRALEGDGMERLVKRSRNWRSEDERIGARKQEDEDLADADVFDDTDFYQHLLRELIESKGAQATSSGVGPESTNEWSAALKRHAKKHKKVVDTRASKGRKIRYEVNERLANFMPLIPNETWSGEQTERLFRQLGGKGEGVGEGMEDGDEAMHKMDDAKEPDLSGFKLFG